MIDLDTVTRLGEHAGAALAAQLERVGRLRPGVDADPDVADHIRFMQSGAFKFAQANGATENEANEAAEAYARAMLAALYVGSELPH